MKLKKVSCFDVSRFRVLAEDFFALTVIVGYAQTIFRAEPTGLDKNISLPLPKILHQPIQKPDMHINTATSEL